MTTKRMRVMVLEIFGWYGCAAILGAYALLSLEVVTSQDLAYQLLNLTGALGLLVISYSKRARQPALVNFAWAVIALVAIVSIVVK